MFIVPYKVVRHVLMICNVNSNLINITTSVLQEIVLALTLFTQYINDLLNKLHLISLSVAHDEDVDMYHDDNPTEAALSVANAIELINEGILFLTSKKAMQFLSHHFLIGRYYHLQKNFWLEILIPGIICPHNLK